MAQRHTDHRTQGTSQDVCTHHGRTNEWRRKSGREKERKEMRIAKTHQIQINDTVCRVGNSFPVCAGLEFYEWVPHIKGMKFWIRRGHFLKILARSHWNLIDTKKKAQIWVEAKPRQAMDCSIQPIWISMHAQKHHNFCPYMLSTRSFWLMPNGNCIMAFIIEWN